MESIVVKSAIRKVIEERVEGKEMKKGTNELFIAVKIKDKNNEEFIFVREQGVHRKTDGDYVLSRFEKKWLALSDNKKEEFENLVREEMKKEEKRLLSLL